MNKVYTWLPRIALLLCGAMLCFVGVSGVMDPTMISGDALLQPDGVTSIRVDYGGFHLGLGLFALFGLFKSNYAKSSLIAATITMVLVVVTRLSGIEIDGANEAQYSILTAEALVCSFAVIGLVAFLLKGNPAKTA